MAAPIVIFQGPLTANFQPSAAVLIESEKVVLDFELVIPGANPVQVQWYPEYAWGSPADPATRWFRETAEEDIGNGDVRMPPSIRRFSTYGADGDLPTGIYRLDVELRRTHKFCRIQLLGLDCVATVYSLFGGLPMTP